MASEINADNLIVCLVVCWWILYIGGVICAGYAAIHFVIKLWVT
jgi:hypothetical protein